MSKSYAHYFNPQRSIRRTTLLKHWHGKRVNVGGKYGKIIEANLDRDLNFMSWTVRFGAKHNWKRITLNDPNYDYNAMTRLTS